MMRHPQTFALATLGALLSGCHDERVSTVQGDDVTYTLSAQGCTPRTLSLAAGAHTFTIRNIDASDISEFELLDGQRIIGEAENLTPGLKGTFSLNLRRGTYKTHCEGTTNGDGVLRVSGAPSAETAQATRRVAVYKEYLETQSDQLVRRSRAFVAAVESGDREAAKRLYIRSRIPYERIEPIAEALPQLDKAIDARENDVAPSDWTGYHHIEQILWSDRSVREAVPYAHRLRQDIAALHKAIASLDLDAPQIANGAVSLLDEVAKTKVTGEEERYSHSDLSDFDANVDGAREAYAALAPMLSTKDPQLTSTLQRRFASLQTLLNRYRSAAGFISYSRLSQSDIRELSAAVSALAEPLSQVARQVTTAAS